MNTAYKSLASVVALVIAGYLPTTAQLTINGRTAVYDTLSHSWLCTAPEECFDEQPYDAPVTMDHVTNLAVNGTPVGDAGYTFVMGDGDKTWSVTYTDATGAEHDELLQFTFLPIVVIDGKVENNNYNTGTVTVMLPDEDVVSPCKVKFRGSSNTLLVKRNYHLKFVDEQGNKCDMKFFDGLRSDNSWILDAGAMDRIRVRNRVLTDLWMDIATPPYYADREPKALTGVRGKIVEVYRNGQYQGVYSLCEAMDRKQLKLKKTDESTGTVHGQLWKVDERTTTTQMETCPQYVPDSITWDGFEIHYPDIDEVFPANFDTLCAAVDMVCNSSDEEFAAQASRYLDIPVLRDMYMFLQVILGYDNMGKNIYWATYDRTEGPMITPVIWDLDATLGQSWARWDYHPSYLAPTVDLYTGHWDPNVDRFLLRLIMWNEDGFNDLAASRYRQLRKGPLSTDSIKARFADYVQLLERCGAAKREEKRYYGCPDQGKHFINFASELSFINNWLDKRMEWLDNKYFAERIPGDVTDDGVIDVSDTNMMTLRILGKDTTPQIYNYKFDIDCNREIDTSDTNALTNKILGK